MTPDERLSSAIEQLTIALNRYNDFLNPPTAKRSEAEFGKADYSDAEKKEISAELTTHLTSLDSQLNRPIRRRKKKTRDND